MTERFDLFLFDVDGVLVYPKGYKEALRASVDRFATLMGLPSMGLTYDEIAVFEACGFTNEWDSLVIIVSKLLIEATGDQTDFVQPSLLSTMERISTAKIQIVRPDFASLAREIAAKKPDDDYPAVAALRLFKEQTPVELHHNLEELLNNIYSLESITTRTFQHYSLGHELFQQTYDLVPDFHTDGFLARYDAPHLKPEVSAQLLDHVSNDHLGITIFTARPSLPPADLPDKEGHTANKLDHPPEGDLAAELLGWQGRIPVIGGGRMMWMAKQNGKQRAAYHKPSPVQALAGIGAAYTGKEYESIIAAATLFEEGQLSGPLSELIGGSFRAVVFEDLTGGIRSGQGAVELLQKSEVDIIYEAVGISTEAAKIEVLSKVTDRIVPNINDALEPYL